MAQNISNPSLQRLDVLVGAWEIESPQFPGGRGSETFEWLEGGAFLMQHSEAKHAGFPNGTMVIGRDEATETYCMLYFDSRGVSRIYQMSLIDGIWKLWREEPGFWQRFSGTFSDDGRTIRGYWEKSDDGSKWEHDFDLIYTKAL